MRQFQMDGFRTLKQGAQVVFEVVQGPKGMLAQNIRAAAVANGVAPAETSTT